jgi:hypothetical protein
VEPSARGGAGGHRVLGLRDAGFPVASLGVQQHPTGAGGFHVAVVSIEIDSSSLFIDSFFRTTRRFTQGPPIKATNMFLQSGTIFSVVASSGHYCSLLAAR